MRPNANELDGRDLYARMQESVREYRRSANRELLDVRDNGNSKLQRSLLTPSRGSDFAGLAGQGRAAVGKSSQRVRAGGVSAVALIPCIIDCLRTVRLIQ